MVVEMESLEANNPLKEQVGGTHYKDCKIQPIEFIHANNIPFCEANAISICVAIAPRMGARISKKQNII